MAIKVQFPAGASETTVRGLYQWDFGQTLEIECAEIGTEALEVHFACHNMTEAVVRACYFESGVGTVEIPDECLEQTSAVTVWLCRSDATQRHTIKTITLPLTARTRPATVRDIPEKYVDSYGQLLSEVSEAVGKLASGEVTAAKAKEAINAGYATSAGSALSATTATTALSCAFKLAATVTITDGTGAAPSLAENTVYLVEFLQIPIVANGVFVYYGGAVQTAHIGVFKMEIVNHGDGDVLTVTNDSGTNASGTLKFYKLGGLS